MLLSNGLLFVVIESGCAQIHECLPQVFLIELLFLSEVIVELLNLVR